MKGRESGMPEADYWETFFEPSRMIETLIPANLEGAVVEFGSGYGTFTLPVARAHSVPVIGLDIESDLVAEVQSIAQKEGLTNVRLALRDFVTDGTGELANSAAHVMLYNILHIENPNGLLTESYRILKSGGTLSIIHWRSDISTPRGPSLAIRPTAEQCIQWAKDVGFNEPVILDIEEAAPFHFGIRLTKSTLTKEIK